MDQAARDVEAKSQQPENQQNYDNCPEHRPVTRARTGASSRKRDLGWGVVWEGELSRRRCIRLSLIACSLFAQKRIRRPKNLSHGSSTDEHGFSSWSTANCQLLNAKHQVLSAGRLCASCQIANMLSVHPCKSVVQKGNHGSRRMNTDRTLQYWLIARSYLINRSVSGHVFRRAAAGCRNDLGLQPLTRVLAGAKALAFVARRSARLEVVP